MSKKPFFILLFIGTLFMGGVVILALRSVKNELLVVAPAEVPFVPQRKTPDGQASSTIRIATSSPLIFDAFREGAFVTSPLVITGKAPGTWYFEGSFPVHVEDLSGNILGQGIAQAKSNWMTTSLVPFQVKITFKKTNAETGFVVFKNDNPSGDPKNSKEVRVPILFKVFLQ